MENSKIQWTTHTFNPWTGCTKVSPGCQNCYAEKESKNNDRRGRWGSNGTRIVPRNQAWHLPKQWNARACKLGERHRVFCASQADVFERWEGDMTDPNTGIRLGHAQKERYLRNEEAPEWYPDPDRSLDPVTMDDVITRTMYLVRDTPHLDWLFVTKRPENVLGTFGRVGLHDVKETLPNIWMGASVENMAVARTRIPALQEIDVTVRFLSVEPMLEELDLSFWLNIYKPAEARTPEQRDQLQWSRRSSAQPNPLHWIICGGESGDRARLFNVLWARRLLAQCQAADVPFFMKQVGANPHEPIDINGEISSWPMGNKDLTAPDAGNFWPKLRDKKGGDPNEWPEYLRVRQLPKTAA
jgi:protein gp37